MSGIAPILDTLLQALLSGAGHAPPRPGAGPARPPAANAVPGAVWKGLAAGTGGTVQVPRDSTASEARLSPAARLIASLLSEEADAPFVIRSPLALLRRGEPAEAAPLGARLQAAIGESGLFYEAHLARWYRKELPHAQLRKEPQMRLAAAEDGARPAPAGAERDLRSNEVLRTLVRHQLELLASPVLRWEGEFWNGIYMSLAIHFPADARVLGEWGGEAEDGAPAQQEGRAELDLEIAGLGLLRAELWLRGKRLSLRLLADSPPPLERLRAGREVLLQRLRDCGFEPRLSLALLEKDHAAG